MYVMESLEILWELNTAVVTKHTQKEEGEGSAWERSWNCLTISSNKCWREME